MERLLLYYVLESRNYSLADLKLRLELSASHGYRVQHMDKLSEIMAAKRRALSKQIRPVRDQELERLGRMQTQGGSFLAVSYTHLTLPTILRV